VGYVNRWTMEITNNSRYYSIPLVVGRRIAQIVFFDTEGIEQQSYEASGKYQTRYVIVQPKPTFLPVFRHNCCISAWKLTLCSTFEVPI